MNEGCPPKPRDVLVSKPKVATDSDGDLGDHLVLVGESQRVGEPEVYGLRSTVGLITGAALIMVTVFSGFAAGDLVAPAQVGFGMAVAILLDATIVRLVLVPSTLKLLCDWNWYLPGFLSRLPDFGVEGDHPPHPLPGQEEGALRLPARPDRGTPHSSSAC